MPDAFLDRVDHQIRWYDRHATTARIWYCSIKLAQIILAASVPVAAGLDLPKLLTGSLGGLIVILEGVQQLYRFHDNWVRYRWTASAMEREKSLWTARAGDYATADRPNALLALRIEDLTSREATQWVALQQPPSTRTGSGAETGAGAETAPAETSAGAENAPAETSAGAETAAGTATGPDANTDEVMAGLGRPGSPLTSDQPADPAAPVPAARSDDAAPTTGARA